MERYGRRRIGHDVPGQLASAGSWQEHPSASVTPNNRGTLELSLGTNPATGSSMGGDSVAYGTPNGATVNEPPSIPGPLPFDGRSLQRKNGGRTDTDKNSADFQVVTADPENLAATAPPPDGTTNDATALTSRSATLNGSVNPHGASVTDCHFDIGTAANSYTLPDIPCATIPSGQSNVNVSAAATGLTFSTTYHYQLSVTTPKGTLTTAGDKAFTTTEPDPSPSATTGTPTIVGSNTATLNGTANPFGATVTDCHFDYGKAANSLTLSVPCATTPTGSDPTGVSARITDLDPDSDYFFHLSVTTDTPRVPNSATGSTSPAFHTLTLGTDTDKVVISELRSRGAGGDFIQLMNITNASVDLPVGWELNGVNSAGSLGCVNKYVANGPAVTLAPGQHYLVGGPGVASADRSLGNCRGSYVMDSDASIQLSAAGVSSDSVAYGNWSSAPAEAPPIATVPSDGTVLQRRNGGRQDTHRNIDDFKVVTDTPNGMAGSAPPPTVATTAATSIAYNAATLNGTVNLNGGTASDCHFEYFTGTDAATSVPCSSTPSGSGSLSVSAAVTGLTPATDYHSKLFVTTTGGSSHGDDQPFTTAPPLPKPTGSTDAADHIAAQTVTLHATANPHGYAVTDCHFDFGPGSGETNSYASSVPCPSSPTGLNDVTLSAPITNLTPSTDYHFRIRVTTDNGSLTGSNQDFTTKAVVPDSDQIVISQFRTTGVTNGDFVELMNVSDHAVDLAGGGWSLTFLYPGAGTGCTAVLNGPSVRLAPGQHYLITQPGWSGTTASDLTFYSGAGGCGDIPDAGVLSLGGGGSDSVAFGNPSGVTIPEPDPIGAVPTDGKALQRRDSGRQDTGNNLDDFVTATADPENFFADPPPAEGTTDAATNPLSAKATLNGSVSPAGETITNCHFEFGTDADFATLTPYPNSVPCTTTPSGLGTVSVSATPTGLTPLTEYHYRLVATGNLGRVFTGGDRQVTTSEAPSASTGDIGSIGSHIATVNASVNPRGETVTQCYFDYGKTTGYGSTKPCASTPSGSGSVPVSAALTGLDPTTDYYVRIHIVTSIAGERTGDAQPFTTTSKLSAATGAVTSPGHTVATLNGTVLPHGEAVSDCHFEYGTDTNYGSSVACAPSTPSGTDPVPVPVTASLTGLTADTQYHAHLLVKTDGGATTIDGGDVQFATTPPPTASTSDQFADVGPHRATLAGTVNPRGEFVNLCRFEYSTDTSYSSYVDCAAKPSGTSSSPVSAVLTGLDPSTSYNVRLRIVTADTDGDTFGGVKVLTTTPLPSASTGGAGTPLATTATLSGSVNPRGESVTDCHFDYGLDSNYGSSKPCATTPSGSGSVPVSAALSGLSPSTGYHYRLILKTDGTPTPADGGDQQFTTGPPPSASTGGAGTPLATTATLSGSVNPRGETVTDCHFDYGLDSNYGSSKPCATTPSGSGSVPVSAALSGLSPSTGYHYRLILKTDGTPTPADGGDQQFTTGPPPAVATDAVSGSGSRSAPVSGSVNARGETVTDCHFDYGTTTGYGSTKPCAPSGPPSARLTGLDPSTEYHVRLDITTAGSGERTGGDESFTTEAPSSATTDAATATGQTAATLAGTVTPHGETVTDCHFEYGTDTNYGSTAACAPGTPSGLDSVPVGASLTGLAAGTGYHVRLVVTTDASSTPIDGGDRSFTTDAAPVVTDPGGTGTPPGGTGTDTSTGTGTQPGGTGTDPPGGTTPGDPPEPKPVAMPSAARLAALAKLSGSKKLSKRGAVTLATLTCPAVCGTIKLVGTVPAKHGKRLVVATGSGSVDSTHPLTLVLQLTQAGKKALKAQPKLQISALLTLTGTDGKKVSVTRQLVLKR